MQNGTLISVKNIFFDLTTHHGVLLHNCVLLIETFQDYFTEEEWTLIMYKRDKNDAAL